MQPDSQRAVLRLYGTERAARATVGLLGQSSIGRGVAVMTNDQSTKVACEPGFKSARNSVHFPFGFNPANDLSVEVRGEVSTQSRGSARRPSGAHSPATAELREPLF